MYRQKAISVEIFYFTSSPLKNKYNIFLQSLKKKLHQPFVNFIIWKLNTFQHKKVSNT